MALDWGGHLVRGVLFDMDGVVVDNIRHHQAAWRDSLRAAYGLALAEDDHRFLAGHNHEVLELITGRAPTPDEASAFHELKEGRYRELARNDLQAVPGLVAYLDWLGELGVPHALVTMADRENVALGLEATGLEGRFALRVTGEDIHRGKPDPEAYLKGAAELELPPGDCLVHEDSLGGVRSGVAAGARVAALATTMPPEALLAAGAGWAGPDFLAWLGHLGRA